MPFYLTPKQDDFNQIPELQVCIAETPTNNLSTKWRSRCQNTRLLMLLP